MTKHVLVPIDGSEQAYAALRYSLVLFPNTPHSVLYVINPTKERYEGPGHAVNWLTKAEREAETMHETAHTIANRQRAPLTETITKRGRPAQEILDYTDHSDIDHICMGSTGRSAIANLLLGSVAETVTQRSPTPVTVVRSVEDENNITPPAQILVGIDGSEPGYDAVRFSLRVFPAASITALHVIESSMWYNAGLTNIDQTVTEMQRDAAPIVEQASEIASGYDAMIQTAVEIGDPSQVITAHIEETGFDHVVIGSHGSSELTHILLGSVAKTLVQRSPTPVTVVR